MQAQLFDIVDRHKAGPGAFAAVGDFSRTAAGAVTAQTILADPNIALYCLDPEQQQAVFVRLPDGAVLHTAPFYYAAQFEHATQLLTIPYQALTRLAEQVDLDDRRLILIYSQGRCGSTLTSAAFGQAPGVVSLSEPDVFTQLVQLRDFSGAHDAEMGALIRSCLLMTCKDQIDGQQPVWALKFRSFAIEIADLIDVHFPRARSLFLYRQAVPWARSMMLAFGSDESDEPLTPQRIREVWMLLETVVKGFGESRLAGVAEIDWRSVLALWWLILMERALERLQAGQAILPVRYESLKAEPVTVMTQILAYCGIDVGNGDWLRAVLGQDSQAGTALSRDSLKDRAWQMTPDDVAVLERIIAAQPVVNRPNYQLPGTLRPGQ